MERAPAPRIGVVRGDRPQPVVAEAEARVLQAELERRLGPVLLDLRFELDDRGDEPRGGTIGPWRPVRHAAWPTSIDARLDLDRLGPASLAPLTALFARTVEPRAGEVRRRMLRHLGLLPRELVDDRLLDELGRATLRPTDVWLLLTDAVVVRVTDPAVAAFGTSADAPAIAALDAALDAVADELAAVAPVEQSLRRVGSRLRAEVDAWRDRAAELGRRLERSEREATDRCDEMADRVEVLRARLERAEVADRLAGGG